jgi:uncharacterized membrane protein
MPVSPLRLLLLFLAFVFLITFVQLGVLTIAFDRLGLSAESAYLLFLTLLLGSAINLPLFSIRATGSADQNIPELYRLLLFPRTVLQQGKTIIAVNVGGCVGPVAFCTYLYTNRPVGTLQVLVAVLLVSVVSYMVSRPIRGIGIGMPILVAPLVAAFAAIWLNPEQSAALAYIGGTLGVLIGADLARLRDIARLGVPVASIGGAGTFDGIFITGIVAVLLA